MRQTAGAVLIAFLIAGSAQSQAADGDVGRGARVFRTCAACHSLEAGHNMTGPSLAGLWNRKAGALENFPRYSPALKSSGVVWNDATLDAWLQDPAHFIPGNTMTFAGIEDARARADLIAFLKQPATSQSAQRQGQMGGMSMGGAAPNLKKLTAQQRVQNIRYCRDTFSVTTADGATRDFWERNLRFKTDSSEEGPENGAPAIIAAGMMGDRASVIFAAPEEIAQFITRSC